MCLLSHVNGVVDDDGDVDVLAVGDDAGSDDGQGLVGTSGMLVSCGLVITSIQDSTVSQQ